MLRIAAMLQKRLFRIRVDNNVYVCRSVFSRTIDIGVKKRWLRIVILYVFNRFRRRPVNECEMCSWRRYRVYFSPISNIGGQERARCDLYSRRASNFPDDKSLWNFSKAWPTTWTSAWRYSENFSSFHQNMRVPLGEAIPRPLLSRVMTFTAPSIVFIHGRQVSCTLEQANSLPPTWRLAKFV